MYTGHTVVTPQQRAAVKDILREARFGYLAVAGGTPYVVPLNFAYVDKAHHGDGDSKGRVGEHCADPEWGVLLFHTGPGRKTDAIVQDARVCLAVLAEAVFTQGELPCEDSYAYRSVLVEGRAMRITDDAERRWALRAIVLKYDPEAADKPFAEEVLEQVRWKPLARRLGSELRRAVARLRESGTAS
jgi:nitroimidazol reductase NimA-like FMN-containing flavoprotein (pyridoxamine 5'-phosphate oxidase superfamily)